MMTTTWPTTTNHKESVETASSVVQRKRNFKKRKERERGRKRARLSESSDLFGHRNVDYILHQHIFSDRWKIIRKHTHIYMHTLQIMDHNHKEEQKKKEYIKQRISFACSMV